MGVTVFDYFVYYHHDSFLFLVFGLNKALVCMPLYLIGMIAGDVLIRSIPCRWRKELLLASLVVSLVSGCVLNTNVSIYSYELGNYAFFMIAALSGSLFVLALSGCALDSELPISRLSSYGVLFLETQYFAVRPYTRIM